MTAGGALIVMIRSVVWVLFLVFAVWCVAHHARTGDLDKTAVQQAARAADDAFWLIAGYGIARAIDSILRR
jgi:hypothetical protein